VQGILCCAVQRETGGVYEADAQEIQGQKHEAHMLQACGLGSSHLRRAVQREVRGVEEADARVGGEGVADAGGEGDGGGGVAPRVGVREGEGRGGEEPWEEERSRDVLRLGLGFRV